jgi:hypothetical protein
MNRMINRLIAVGIILLGLFGAYASQCWAADVVRYVDTGSAGGDGTTSAVSGDHAAYTSLAAWEAAEQCDLTDNGGDTMTVYCNRTNGGGIDGPVAINGFTTSESCWIKIIGLDFPSDGVFDDTKHLIAATEGQNAISIYDDFVQFINIQITATSTSSGSTYGIAVALQSASSVLTIDSCIIKGICSGTGSCYGINTDDADVTVNIYNTLVYGFYISDDFGYQGIRLSNGVMNIYNCTLCNNYIGIWRTGGTLTVANCAVFNNTDDFNGTITIDHCASDDGDGTNAVDISPGGTEADDWDAAFTDYSSGDFSVKDTDSVLYHAGTDVGLDTDIIGTAWNDPPSIGAFEYAAGEPPVTAVKAGQVIPIYED